MSGRGERQGPPSALILMVDPSPADWIVRHLIPWGPPDGSLPVVGSLLPPGFESYVRLQPPGQSIAGSLDRGAAYQLTDILGAATDTPHECLMCVWDGWGGSWLPELVGAANVVAPHRRFVMFCGPLDALDVGGDDAFRSPNLWWPRDHRWCVATDVDLRSTYVACDRTAAAALTAQRGLRATLVSREHELREDG